MRIQFKDYLREQLTHRYEKPENIKRHSTNIISNKAIFEFLDDIKIGERTYISPNIASMTNNDCVDIKQLYDRLNIDMGRVASNIKKIKKMNDLEIISIGYGGFSINVIHFMYLLGLEVGEVAWIRKLTIYEDDNISLTNSFRIYKDMTKINGEDTGTTHKTLLLQDDRNIAKEVTVRHNRFFRVQKREEKNDFSPNIRRFYFGAPDFETRKILEKEPFIFTGHSGNEVDFYSRPVVDADLTRETYGKIDLDYFFCNLMKSAEQLIEIFANYEESDLKADTKIWSYNSEKEKIL